ncbi:MAG: hypothetical protein DME33_06360 [Verrucomicrobia bacterium]|nr:MAG: hypothetical protein DME33_06360 [Verrucomicrobiota bacterium]
MRTSCAELRRRWNLLDISSSWANIKTDVKNAGGKWVNEEVVVDNRLVISRKPDDSPALNKK